MKHLEHHSKCFMFNDAQSITLSSDAALAHPSKFLSEILRTEGYSQYQMGKIMLWGRDVEGLVESTVTRREGAGNQIPEIPIQHLQRQPSSYFSHKMYVLPTTTSMDGARQKHLGGKVASNRAEQGDCLARCQRRGAL